MSRACFVGLIFLVLLWLVPCFAADDRDPSVAGKKASEWLTILRTDKEARKRRGVLIVLEIFGPAAPGVLPGVHKSLREDEDETIRVASAQLLGRMANKARDLKVDLGDSVDALTASLKSDKSDKVREAAARALGEMGTDARFSVATLAGALKDKSLATREAAAASLGKLGPDAASALTELLETAKDKSADRLTRAHAAFALGRLGGEVADKTVPALGAFLSETDSPPEVRKAAAEALGRLAGNAKNAVPALAAALKDKQLDVRRAAAVALDLMGTDAKPAFATLKQAARDEDKSVRAQVAHALGNLGKEMPAEVVPVLVDRLQDTVLDVRVAAALALGFIGPEAKAAVPALTGAARDGLAPLREAAGEALKKIQMQ
jgi:HEAT repeat protein